MQLPPQKWEIAMKLLTSRTVVTLTASLLLACVWASAPAVDQASGADKESKVKIVGDKELPQVNLQTSQGDVIIELYEDNAPNTVANFISLVEAGKYDGLKFHRVIDGFMAQGGDPKGDGTGGPGYHIKCECYLKGAKQHERGSLSMAHAGRDTGGSQFFITFIKTDWLDGKHTVFGKVIKGMDNVDKLTRTQTDAGPVRGVKHDIIKKAVVVQKRDH